MQFRLRFDIEVIKPWIIAVIGTRFGFALLLTACLALSGVVRAEGWPQSTCAGYIRAMDLGEDFKARGTAHIPCKGP